MEPSNQMAADPDLTATGIGAVLVGALLIVRKFFMGASEPPPEKREELRRDNDKLNELMVKNIAASVDNLAQVMQIHNTHQQEFREDFREAFKEFKTNIDGKISEFKSEVRDDIRELRGLK